MFACVGVCVCKYINIFITRNDNNKCLTLSNGINMFSEYIDNNNNNNNNNKANDM